MQSRLLLALAVLIVPAGAAAKARTRVVVNGTPTPVWFNDGDSFSVLEGPLAGTKARLAGFNTLESFGPVHQWGTWTARELYVLAKGGTMNGRKGIWSCTWDRKRDGYGRGLFNCPSLAEDQIRKGLAHAMTVTADPSPPSYVAAQQEAIAARRGIWAHGVPEYVLTSLHSFDEDPGRQYAYNRLVSSADGHSEMWEHRKIYSECETVCAKLVDVTPDSMEKAVGWLEGASDISDLWMGLNPDQKRHVVRIWSSLGSVAALVPRDRQDMFRSTLGELSAAGVIQIAAEREQSCAVYIHYKRRFGSSKAPCLK